MPNAIRSALRASREKAGLTQLQLSERMNVSVSTVANFEKRENDVRFDTVIRYCKALGACDITLDGDVVVTLQYNSNLRRK